MKLKLVRKYKLDTYTIGKLYIDDIYFCDTLEDKDRGLTSDMSLSEIQSIKIKGNTCIPYGQYQVTLKVKSQKYSNPKYKYARIANGYMPRILNVKGFDGILIHAGNSDKDTEGCILVGENKVKGKVINSQATWTKLYNILKASKDDITIDITK